MCPAHMSVSAQWGQPFTRMHTRPVCSSRRSSSSSSCAGTCPGVRTHGALLSLLPLCLPCHAQSGLDLVGGEIRDNIAAGVVEPALSKLKILQVRRTASSPTQPPARWRCHPLQCHGFSVALLASCGGSRAISSVLCPPCPAACRRVGHLQPAPIVTLANPILAPPPSMAPNPLLLQFATEAAITILRIDDLIRLEPEPQEGEE